MRLFLDSNVILSRLARELVIAIAQAGKLEIAYSRSVEAESLHVAERNGITPDIAAAFTSLRLHVAPVEAEADASLWLPDENDRHVLAGAIASGSDIILTENLRDFPKSALAPHDLVAQSPDDWFALHFPEIEEIVIARLNALGATKSALKAAKLYRLSKLVQEELIGN